MDDELKKGESHITSAAAFVEGGIQDACDDACSICLEAFCDSDPSTVNTMNTSSTKCNCLLSIGLKGSLPSNSKVVYVCLGRGSSH